MKNRDGYSLKTPIKKSQKPKEPRLAPRGITKLKLSSIEMATLNITMEELYAQFEARAFLKAKVSELEAKLAAVEMAPTKAKKVKEPKEPKSKKPGLPPDELAERRRQNGLRLAAANKARKEAEHQAWLAAQLDQKKVETASESSESSSDEDTGSQQETDNE